MNVERRKSDVTTHVLDTAWGQPAAGVPVKLEVKVKGGWRGVGRATTDENGRVENLMREGEEFRGGDYRLVFDAGAYFAAQGVDGFYTEITVAFVVRDTSAHYHVPLLLSPYGYSTYRGS